MSVGSRGPRSQCMLESAPVVPWPASRRLTMTDVLSLPVLVLNRHLSPVQVTTVKRAIVLMYGGVANALDEIGEAYEFDLWRDMPVRDDDDAIPIVGGAIRVPRVVNLLRYDRTPRVTVPL